MTPTMKPLLMALALLGLLLLAQNLNRNDAVAEEREKYIEMLRDGVDEVTNTNEAIFMRNYHLRLKKQKGIFRKHQASLASILFPGVSPEEYYQNEEIVMYANLVQSKRTQVPFEFSDLPMCPAPTLKLGKSRKNLGSHLQGHDLKSTPYAISLLKDQTCTPVCVVRMGATKLGWMRELVERQYRIHMTLDQLPVLMRSKELNYAVRGYPLGFKAPPLYTGLVFDEFYLYNHIKFTITYHEDPDNFNGFHITGFDVHPVTIEHKFEGQLTPTSRISTCNAPGVRELINDPGSYLALRTGTNGEPLQVLYSYEVKWVASDLPWADRWDVYLVGSLYDDSHHFAVINSLMIVLLSTGAIATVMIRALRKDIAGYNEIQTLEESNEETGWQSVRGDVFRPPQTGPMMLCVLVGTGAQVGTAFFLSMVCAILGLVNPMEEGQTLTAMMALYVLCGIVAGYISARLYKLCEDKSWKRNAIMTAVSLPGTLVGTFLVLNVLLTAAGAATAVSFWIILAIFFLWLCVLTPLVVVGSSLGCRGPKEEVPTKTNQIARVIPDLPWHVKPVVAMLLGGILPFVSVWIELESIMNALWRNQIYFEMGYVLVVVLISAATCAEVAIVLCYLQLRSEDHRWWWKSFFNCASAGFYLFLYSLWFMWSRLELVGGLPVIVYLSYMSMISICFGLVCGTIGFLASAWFAIKIYSAVKVD